MYVDKIIIEKNGRLALIKNGIENVQYCPFNVFKKYCTVKCALFAAVKTHPETSSTPATYSVAICRKTIWSTKFEAKITSFEDRKYVFPKTGFPE